MKFGVSESITPLDCSKSEIAFSKVGLIVSFLFIKKASLLFLISSKNVSSLRFGVLSTKLFWIPTKINLVLFCGIP